MCVCVCVLRNMGDCAPGTTARTTMGRSPHWGRSPSGQLLLLRLLFIGACVLGNSPTVLPGPGPGAACRASAMDRAFTFPSWPGLAHCCRRTFASKRWETLRVKRAQWATSSPFPSRGASCRASAMDSAFTVPQLHKVAASAMASLGTLLPQHLWVKRARGEHFVSSECNGQRVHRSRPGAYRVERARWIARSPSRSSIKSQRA